MENLRNSPEAYNYRDYDRIWQRVSPSLQPYPGTALLRQAPAESTEEEEEQLPGAQENPCCMGTAAQDMQEVIEGYILNELQSQRTYCLLARQFPSISRTLRELAAAEGAHARRLQAVYYLITGSCYRPVLPGGTVSFAACCQELRQQFHEESCEAINYLRSAEGTTDPCLQALFRQLSQDEFAHAERLLQLLERQIRL